jgi:Raf kinase inhibitor-like YbhB/YbcL family protein
MADFKVTSSQIKDGEQMPESTLHGWAGGPNLSPELTWSGAPEGTQSYAVTIHDPDAPTGVGFVHWLIFNIPASVTSLEAGAGSEGKNPPGSVQGITDFGVPGYGGAAPPPGDKPHRYDTVVYALDVPKLDLTQQTTYALLRFNMRGHVLAEAKISPIFSR